MKCLACNTDLTDFESTRKSLLTGEYVDLCAGCFRYVATVFNTRENFGLYDASTDTMDFDTTEMEQLDISERLPNDETDDFAGGSDED